jgi:hypothetical protein
LPLSRSYEFLVAELHGADSEVVVFVLQRMRGGNYLKPNK